ncbi:MAG: fatty acid--CoA ligase family protein [Verrucomicrobiota bacterium]|nr:fatty acid--CoA ligase family protein [Verrucomicrobiota bacterium]
MSWIRTKLEAFAGSVAGHEAGRVYLYSDFLELLDQASNSLPFGAKQVIEVSCNTTIESLASLLAIAQSRHIALPLPTELTKIERERMLKVAGESSIYEKLESSGLILFSSGTSNEPKGMLHNFEVLVNRYKDTSIRKDRCLQLLLIDHIGGLDTAFRCLFAGSTLVVPDERTPEAVGLAIESKKVNILPASPTFFNLLLLAKIPKKYDLSSVRILAYGAEPMSQKLLKSLSKTFPKARLQQKFGTSETGAIRIRSTKNESLFFSINDPETAWKIIEDELWLKTPSRIIGYLDSDQDQLKADGWYATGDLVEDDGQGNLRIVGRTSEVINVGGQKVNPCEIESILIELKGVESVRVYGIKNPITGDGIACEIVSSECKSISLWKREIRRHCRKELQLWKIPTNIIVVKKVEVNSRMKRKIKSL